MKPGIFGPSICMIAASGVGRNLSGLLPCATIIVTSARISRLVICRAAMSSIAPAVAR